MSKFKVLFILFILLSAGFYLHIHSKRSDFFSPDFITYDQSLWPKFETTPLSSEKKELIKTILNQPFTFLGSGNQTFAFESKDRVYVLKLFKFQHLKEQNPLHLFERKTSASRKRRLEQVFAGHYIAYELDPANSGLIYAHLNQQEILNVQANVSDSLGREYSIPLDRVVFILQKKAISFRELLSAHLDKGEIEKSKDLIRKMLAMYRSSYQKGIYDRDHNIMHNTGFIRDEPIRIDVGKLKFDENMKDQSIYMKDLEKIAWERIDRWMQRYYPAYRQIIADEMVNFLKN